MDDGGGAVDEIIESLPSGFIAVDRDWRITHVNGAAERFTGIERAAVIGQDYWTAFPNRLGSPFEEPMRRAMRDRVATSAEHFYAAKQRWFLVEARPLASGGLAIHSRDTTDQRRAEEEARQLAHERDAVFARLQAQFERMPVACMVSNPSMRVMDWNPAAERVFGYTRAEILGRDGYALLMPTGNGGALAEVVRLIGEGELEGRMIHVNVTKDGRAILCEWHNTPLRDHEGRVIGVLAMAEDITAHTEAERRIRQSESMLAEAQRIAKLGSWNLDLSAGELTWSDEHYRLFGIEPDGSASSERFILYIHPDDRDRVTARVRQAIADHLPFEMSWRAVRADGELRFMQSVAKVAVDATGKTTRLFGTMQDVTEREALLASERLARTDAEAAARVRDEFLATLSHELRTPLSAIISWADLIKLTPSDVARVERGLEIIGRNARAQAQLVGDLLDLSRIVSGKLRLEVQRVSLPDLVEAAVQSMRPAAEARGIRLALVMEPVEVQVHGDTSRLQQVVWNLISNAVKFTREGGHVHVVLSRVNSQLEISVSDDGKGIDSAFLPHVFSRFRQADASAAREHGGLGIGLALVKEIVEMHGGTVTAASEGPGRGATFAVRLPIAIVTSATGEPRLHPRVPAALSMLDITTPRLGGVRVLVVDDEPDALEAIRYLLAGQQADVTAVGSVDAALSVLDSQSFDVLLSDIGMPRRDGYELIAEVRRRGLKLPAAAVTAFARSEDRTRALLSGFQAHLAKPLEVSELVATVASLLGRLN